jgi:glutathione S-transferase
MNPTLIIGNKNYSSWSMRPWVLLKHFGIPFNELMLKFHSEAWDNHIALYSPSRRVPVLWEGEPGNSFAVWDSLAIMERVADLHPEKAIWPRDPQARALARAVSSEMHSGFQGVRSAMPMNIRGSYPGKGHTPQALADIQRITALWQQCHMRYGGGKDFLFGDFCAADAMFAPVVFRIKTYAAQITPQAQRYCEAMQNNPAIAAWVKDALAEPDVVAEDEPYAE